MPIANYVSFAKTETQDVCIIPRPLTYLVCEQQGQPRTQSTSTNILHTNTNSTLQSRGYLNFQFGGNTPLYPTSSSMMSPVSPVSLARAAV